MAFDWVAAVLAANQKASLKINDNYMYYGFCYGIGLVTQTSDVILQHSSPELGKSTEHLHACTTKTSNF